MTPTLSERNGVSVGTPEYHGRNRFPKKQAKGICRGCRGNITEKRRQTWCSDSCKEKFDPFFVKQAVRKRDKVCVFCGREAYRNRDIRGWDYKMPYAEWISTRKEMMMFRAEYDHIIPHSEGGLFTVENIRLLCHSCHVKRTTEWRRGKSLSLQREAGQATLNITYK